MTNLPKLRTQYGQGVGIEIFFQFPDLRLNEKTFLDADSAAGATTLTANGLNFSTGQYIVIGNPGSEKTEIVRIHASTAPTSTAITLSAAASFAHNRGDVIRFIPYNQITPERSTDSGSNFSALSAINIRSDALETYLQRASDASTDVYRFRFSNSADSTNSAYSDNTTASGYADNTVYSIIRRALDSIGENFSETINDRFLKDALFEGRRELDQDPRVLRWKFRTKFNTDIGNCIPGQYTVTSPTDLRDRNSRKNILAIRIGRLNTPLRYQDVRQFNENYYNIAHTTLNGALVTSDTSIVLTASGDFDESGSIKIGGSAVTGTLDTVAYTANAESTNTLSGVTGIQAAGHTTGRDVWQGATFGIPRSYTVDNALVRFNIPFSDSVAGENIWMDYYQALQAADSDADILDEPFYDLYLPWLRWKIKYKKSNGAIERDSDSDYKDWLNGKERVIAQEVGDQKIFLYPDIDGMEESE